MIWRLKILAKLILSRLPVPYDVWKRIGLFRHGRMDDPAYPLKIFRLHATRTFPNGFPENFTCLELGPGDSVAAAVVARAHGAAHTYMVDVGAYATKDIDFYKRLATYLGTQGLTAAPDLTSAQTIDDVLRICGGVYMTDGVGSLRQIPAQSVDLIWSHSVLEHVRRAEFLDVMNEFHRILNDTGRASHNIDLQDHLSHALNNLRFPATFWENEMVAASGFYTNRLQQRDIMNFIRQAGFKVLFEETGKWPALPTPRAVMVAPFRDVPVDDLIIRTSSVILAR